MRKSLVAGNWKMVGSLQKSTAWTTEFLSKSQDLKADIVVFPPFLYLDHIAKLLTNQGVAIGAQTLSEHTEGAYTGEIAATMLLDIGCQYVLVGHSERRTLFHEDNTTVAAKFKRASEAGLMPILCVGETLAQREDGKTISTIKAQLDSVLSLEIGSKALYNAVVAYEPVWAIGTGLTATPAQAQEVHAAIRAHIASKDEAAAQQLRIVYGGSVNRQNAKALMEMPDIDGGLIGGASLDAQHFLDIASVCNNLL